MDLCLIVDALGGNAAVASALGVSSPAVSHWTADGRVPLSRVPDVLRLARRHGLVLSPSDLRPDYAWAVICAGLCR